MTTVIDDYFLQNMPAYYRTGGDTKGVYDVFKRVFPQSYTKIGQVCKRGQYWRAFCLEMEVALASTFKEGINQIDAYWLENKGKAALELRFEPYLINGNAVHFIYATNVDIIASTTGLNGPFRSLWSQTGKWKYAKQGDTSRDLILKNL